MRSRAKYLRKYQPGGESHLKAWPAEAGNLRQGAEFVLATERLF